MPFLISPAALAKQALRAIDSGASERVIPWQMAGVARLLKLLPNALFDRLLTRRAHKPRRDRA
jgi:short-subunit dehydrogenase